MCVYVALPPFAPALPRFQTQIPHLSTPHPSPLQVLQKNVESILERGQKLEDLVMQSEQLSMQTKMMYKSVNKSPGWFEDCCGIV
jgi:hypothetical protein